MEIRARAGNVPTLRRRGSEENQRALTERRSLAPHLLGYPQEGQFGRVILFIIDSFDADGTKKKKSPATCWCRRDASLVRRKRATLLTQFTGEGPQWKTSSSEGIEEPFK